MSAVEDRQPWAMTKMLALLHEEDIIPMMKNAPLVNRFMTEIERDFPTVFRASAATAKKFTEMGPFERYLSVAVVSEFSIRNSIASLSIGIGARHTGQQLGS